MALKPGQKKCIETLDQPLVVSAGAGSGKTFTLTRRIVHALASGAVDDISQVMAITFTTKAAGEIRSRVKSALRAEGLVDQALKVDSAWISTIHGMCSRMLRNHAVDLGIDPAFTIIAEADAKVLMDEAIETALKRAQSGDIPGIDAQAYRRLFYEYRPQNTGSFGGITVRDVVQTLVVQASAHPYGMGDVVFPPKGKSPTAVLSALIDLSDDVLAHLGGVKQGARITTFRDKTEAAQREARAALEAQSEKPIDIVTLCNAFPMPTATLGGKDLQEYMTLQAMPQYGSCMMEAVYGLSREYLVQLRDIAHVALELFQEAKSQQGCLDNNDLLVYAYRALTEYPEVAHDYEQRFKLIMVDEFQDTDQLQIDMIMRLAGDHGERLCVVGDAQQSIYRFRGADVSVYQRHLNQVRAQNEDGIILLPDNFRSSSDVLSLVDRIFEQPSVFGSSFMSLAPARDEARVKQPFLSPGPRVDVQVIAKPRTGCALSSVDYAAQGIAERFEALRESGHSAGEMVILLGTTTHAGAYAQALRDKGFACVIVKGSIFSKAPEVLFMVELARMLENPYDTQRMFSVLSSDMFALTADDLVQVSSWLDDANHWHKGNITKGVQALAFACRQLETQQGKSENEDATPTDASGNDGSAPLPLSPTLKAAVLLVSRALGAVGRRPLDRIMMDMVRESGWLSALEAQGAEGQAVVGNIYKAIRICEQLQADTIGGLGSVAEKFHAYVESAKESPGALSNKGNEFVRIMTIHASKGLEFPIVAVAELQGVKHMKHGFICEGFQGKTYASMGLSQSVSGMSSSTLYGKSCPADSLTDDDDPTDLLQETDSPVVFRAALGAYKEQEDTAEKQRLLYVALTRAKEALIISMTTTVTKSQETENGIVDGVYADIQQGLCGPGGIIEMGVTYKDYGGTRPARIECIDLLQVEQSLQRHVQAGPTDEQFQRTPSVMDCFGIVEQGPSLHCKEIISSGKRHNVFSYSQLGEIAAAESLDDAHVEVIGTHLIGEQVNDWELADVVDEDAAAWQQIRKSLADKDKATDFGTAFHRLAEYGVMQRNRSHGVATLEPSHERIVATAQTLGLSETQIPRLTEALQRWCGSTLAKALGDYTLLRAEEPFFVRLEHDGSEVFMEGEMDLLAVADPDAARAVVVDYKTGGSLQEADDQLKRKHLLQASCYAYAVLKRGFDTVDLVFVRVEQPDVQTTGNGAIGEPQYVHYVFDRSCLWDLEMVIMAQFARTR